MRAQDELKILFQEIERSSDRALAGLHKVRSSAKVEAFPSNKQMIALQTMLFGALASLMALWLHPGS